MAAKTPDLEPKWLEVLGDEFDKDHMNSLRNFLTVEMKQNQVFPPSREIFNAFKFTPFNKVKVVILGQDPYHNVGQAHGLCFSVQAGIRQPPSLINIFKELKSDLDIDPPSHGCLTSWAEQGVFLLNNVLTVRAHQAHSHAGQGWEQFTERAIRELNEKREHLVFILWGAPAQRKADFVDSTRHLVLRSPHPSPLSASRGFFGCKHFSQANRYLVQNGITPVDWRIL